MKMHWTPVKNPVLYEYEDGDYKKVAGSDVRDLYPPTIFKRPCSNCENEDSINICDQCCFNYDSWFKKKEGEGG